MYEIWLAKNKQNMKSSAGTVGLTSRVYKAFTDEFCLILANTFNLFVEGGELSNSFYLTIIELFSESDNDIYVQDVCPISFLSFEAKIGS